MGDPRLAELARRHGVATAYDDVWGERHEASDATLRALLAAMHVDATDAARIEAAIAGHEYARRAQTLPAAVVVRVAALADGIRIQLPAALAGHSLAWRITEESGRVHNGSFNLRNLVPLETFDVDGEERRAVQLRLPATLAPGLSPAGTARGHRAARARDADRRAGPLLSAGNPRAGRPRLGRRAAAVFAALRAQLGHRRLHRSAPSWSRSGARAARTSSASIRCMPCSCTIPATRARTARRAGCS